MSTSNYAPVSGLLSRAEAEDILRPYIPDLVEDLYAAWDWVQAFLNEDPERRLVFDLSNQAADVFNRFVYLAERRFPGRTRRQGRLLTITFDRGLILRFKKFDEQLRSKNIRTNAQRLIYGQMTFDGFEPCTHVTFGYQTDAVAQNILGVFVACPNGWTTNAWVIPVLPSADSLPLLTLAPVGPTDDAPGFTIETNEESQKKSS